MSITGFRPSPNCIAKVDSTALKLLKEKHHELQDIYTASIDNIPSSERRLVRGYMLGIGPGI